MDLRLSDSIQNITQVSCASVKRIPVLVLVLEHCRGVHSPAPGFATVICGTLFVGSLLNAQQVPPSEAVLPSNTRAYVSIDNVNRTTESWEKSSFGQLMADPLMQHFKNDLRQQSDEQGLTKYRLGLEWNDVAGVASGEVALAYVHLSTEKLPAMVMLADVTGNDDAKKMLSTASANLVKQGYKKNVVTHRDVSITHHQPPKGSKRSDGYSDTLYFRWGGLLCATDNISTAKNLIDRLAGKSSSALRDVKGFKAIMARARRDMGDLQPHLRWFLDPFGFVESRRAEDPRLKPKKRPDPFEVYKAEGFTAIQAIGGFVNLNLGEYDILHRTMIYAPPPYKRAMRMIRMVNSTDASITRWVPYDVATCVSVNIDIVNAFDHYGTLFDQLHGDGGEGYWDDVLEGLEVDEYGPMVKMRKELIVHFKKRGVEITKIRRPITPDSEQRLIGVPLSNTDTVSDSVQKLMTGDPRTLKKKLAGHTVYEIYEDDVLDEYEIPLPGPKPPLSWVVCVARDHLFVASKLDILAEVLEPLKDASPLAQTDDFKMVSKELTKLGASNICVRSFQRTESEYEMPYELLRQGKLLESDTTLSRLLKQVMPTETEDKSKNLSIDGRKLPEFDKVRAYFGLGGSFGTSENEGWFLKGFVKKP